ncbi:MAG TPA: hypothetical protein VMX57_02970 [Planctomycetota bacterium]|nr:hypothetical protein [Planctomycetota bacterium]
MTINSDGTIAFASVLELSDPWEYRYTTAAGTWKLEHDTARGSNVTTKNTLSLDMRTAGKTVYHYLYFAEDRGPLLLWNYYGDPDSWEFLEYTRIPSPTAPAAPDGG